MENARAGMTERRHQGPGPQGRPGDLAAMVIVGLTLLLLPLGILARGYMPPDDALRHAAFAVTHRTWPQVIIGRPEALFDQSPGWHALLRALHGLLGWGPEALVTFSIAGLLVCFLATGLPLVRRWENWAAALGLLFLGDPATILRFTLGRPFILTSLTILILLGTSRDPVRRPWGARLHLAWLGLAALAAACHGSWYLLAMAPGALLLTGRFREALRMGAVVAAGVVVGAVLTGHPVTLLAGNLMHLRDALGHAGGPHALVSEFLPGRQPRLPLVLALAAGAAAVLRTRSLRLLREPLFLLALVTWGLGYYKVWRFYLDFSFPALALWMAWALDDALEGLPGRWAAALAASVLLAAVILPDRGGRWSKDGTVGGLDPRIPAQAALLPDPGGIIYSNTMFVFYQDFFRNPDADWRYVLAYEPGMMWPGDRAIVDALYAGADPAPTVAPWVARMTPRDRMIIDGMPGWPPPVPALRWTRAGYRRWSGRLP